MPFSSSCHCSGRVGIDVWLRGRRVPDSKHDSTKDPPFIWASHIHRGKFPLNSDEGRSEAAVAAPNRQCPRNPTESNLNHISDSTSLQ
ncbi:hypothetical protein AVEN_85838-1 [Araneus ventricosus]|uniref:Uncharacterized protein n=1 Tax=Araneus ventricosus TaxID=182803 RepID=A0A4Y2GZB7_ARAVE|nr:hypothetical protein AVEN_85838-1 [Araneus ventricosus]